ncbi:Dimodular nonribosomal peptide synthase [Nocardiopsis dassonvillei]|uniref:amino acid adenylation domain-containing protein n=1 Tax=Nocardiopsis dassonvillei TaxID=2014 RepID=UPI003F56F5FC
MPGVPVNALPLTAAQRGIWFASRVDETRFRYWGDHVRISGRLRVDLFERAVRAAVAETEALNTVFGEDRDGVPWQLVRDRGDWHFETVDLTGRPDPLRPAEEHMGARLGRAVDLTKDPLFDCALYRIGAEEYLWQWSVHHIALDGAGLAMVLDRIGAHYRALAEGGDAGPSGFGTLAALVEEDAGYGRSSRYERDREYWDTLMGGREPRRRPQTLRDRDFHRTLHKIPSDRANLLKERAAAIGTAWPRVAMAAGALYEHLVSGRHEVTLTIAVHGRTTGAARRTPCTISNFLPVALDLDPDMTMADLLEHVSSRLRGPLAHHRFRGEDIAGRGGDGRGPWGYFGPLVNTIPTPFRMDLGGPEACFDSDTAWFPQVEDLVAFVSDRGAQGELHVHLGSDTALYPAPLVDAEKFASLCEQILLGPDRRVGDLPDLFTAAGGLPAAPAEAAPFTPPSRGVHELFREQVDRSPDAVALVFEGHELSYRSLNSRADRLARCLAGRGVGRGDLVGVLLERDPDLVTALLAVLKTGAGYVPLDPAFPTERLAAMVRASGAELVVSRSALAERAGGSRPGLLLLDTDAAEISAHPDGDFGETVSGEDVACVMFTSGSTGAPKGVVTPHRALVGTYLGQDYTDFDADQVWLQCSPISWDAFALELFGALLFGGRCVLQPGQKSEPTVIADLVARHGVTQLQMSAGLFNLMLDEHPEVFDVLRLAMTAGEAASAAHVGRALSQHAPIRVVNGYGPVENTGFSTSYEAGPADAHRPSVPIGLPLAGARAYVLNERLRALPAGVPGELYLAGAGMALGYIGQPGLTAERFVPDPFGGPGGRMYRTGDRVRWSGEGVLEFLGRVDDQVKIRGFRVEPGEVGAVVSGQPGVGLCAVVVREDRPGDRRLVAYVVPEGEGVEAASLRARLAGVLPEYMVPSAVVVLDRLPVNTNGKLDRRALPVPDYGALGGGREPRTVQEELLCRLFAEVLGLERVGVDDSFFDLGGHSLLAARLIARIRTVMGAEVRLRDLFRTPTVAGVAAVLGAGSRPPLGAGRRPDRLPLSFAQSRLWFLDRFEGPGTAYNVPVVLRLRGEVRESVLEAALGDVLERHEVLRTVFPSGDDGEPFQKVIPPHEARPVFEVVDHPAGALDAEIDRAAGHVFDLGSEIPVRARLLRGGDDGSVLVLLLHHIVTDGWSMRPLLADLAAAYTARSEGRAPEWEPLPVQYADYALWQRDLLGAEDDPESLLSRQSAFWRSTLEGAPEALELPTGRPRPGTVSGRTGQSAIRVDPGLYERLGEVARAHGVTLFMVLQAALAVTLSKSGAGTDIPLGTPVAGRSDEALDDLVGFFVNTLVLRTDVSGNPTFARLLERVREADLAAFDHQELPFDRVVEAVAPRRSVRHHPLFQVMLVLQNTPGGGMAMPGVEVSREPFPWANAKFDLAFVFDEGPEGLSGNAEFPEDVFERSAVEALVERLGRVLAAVAGDPGVRVGGIDVLSPGERHRVLAGGDGPAVPTADGRTVHEAFEERVRRAPESTALLFEDRRVSYGELNTGANRLARELIARGVGPEHRVAIALPRGTDMITSALAVLKAGASYLPIDTNYPRERIAFMLSDAEPSLVITGGAAARTSLGVPSLVLDDEETAAGVLDRCGRDVSDGERLGPVRGDNAVYVIYTSGSTGVPKGAVNTHSAVVNMVCSVIPAFGLGPGDVFAQAASFSFDAASFEWCNALLSGAALALPTPGLPLSGEDLVDFLRAHAVTHAVITPAVLGSLPDGAPAALPGLRLLCAAGEACPPETVARWSGGRTMVNAYGPTEAAVCSTMSGPLGTGPRVDIGRPLPNTRVRVLDEGLMPAPVGVAGELYLAGAQVARGYHGRPGLTAERFVPDPFGGPGGRMYRTGDRVRWSGEGVLEFLGRVDDQVKIRGFRVEPGEVGAVVSGQPGVGLCAVVVREDRPGDRRLVAYVVPEGEGVEAASLRARLAGVLPEYMVPSAVVVLDRLPVNTNGKLDRRALPVPDYGALGGGREPRTVQEELLCRLFAEVLGLERVGVDDSFFDLGGHSLLATRLLARIRSDLGTDVSLKDLFTGPSPAALAERVKLAEPARPRPALTRRTRSGVVEGGPQGPGGGAERIR